MEGFRWVCFWKVLAWPWKSHLLFGSRSSLRRRTSMLTSSKRTMHTTLDTATDVRASDKIINLGDAQRRLDWCNQARTNTMDVHSKQWTMKTSFNWWVLTASARKSLKWLIKRKTRTFTKWHAWDSLNSTTRTQLLKTWVIIPFHTFSHQFNSTKTKKRKISVKAQLRNLLLNPTRLLFEMYSHLIFLQK